jgi:hypothetical protein
MASEITLGIVLARLRTIETQLADMQSALPSLMRFEASRAIASVRCLRVSCEIRVHARRPEASGELYDAPTALQLPSDLSGPS